MVDELDRKIKQLEIEREAIKRENDIKKLEELNKEIANLSEERDKYMIKWKSEKEIVDRIQISKKSIEDFKLEADQSERNGDYGRVAEIRYGLIKKEEETILDCKHELKEIQASETMIKEEVDVDDIAEVVSRWTGIPVSKMLEGEMEKLLHLEDELHKRIIGQDEAIEVVSDALRRSRAGLQDANRPIGSFIFLGTTGVGKTELAKALAELLFDNEELMTRIDMSEYQERHSVSRLIGAPPGYVGYDEGGQLTEAVRRKPYSIVLLDEIEKAHKDVFNILLQVLDDGRLTDNKGRHVNFKNTIIIMTSNTGSHLIYKNFESLNETNRNVLIEKTKNEVFELLKQTIRPEFLNRIDEMVMFTPLSKSEVKDIVRIQLNILKETLLANNVKISFTEKSISLLSELGYDPQFGARPIKRVIQRNILNELSKQIISGNIKSDDIINIDEKEGYITFNNE